MVQIMNYNGMFESINYSFYNLKIQSIAQHKHENPIWQ